MYNSRNIIIGILVFVALLIYPFLTGLGRTQVSPEISLDTPAIQQLAVKECIEDTDFMRSNHMALLSDWKVTVVRDGNRVYVAEDGQDYIMSLQNTCMECHSNKAQFCDACHEFSGVQTPNCWTCHVEPREGI